MNRSRKAIVGSMSFASLVVSAGVCLADALDSGLIGAWTTSAADCARLFQRQGGGIAYRQPVDKFAQAVIFGAQEIHLPSSTCRVQNVLHASGATKISAECNDSISFTPQTVQIKVTSGGEIIYSPTGDPALDTTLVKCRL
jgi:hypothetical protein